MGIGQRLERLGKVGGRVLGFPHCLLANCSITSTRGLVQRTGGQGQLGPRWGWGCVSRGINKDAIKLVGCVLRAPEPLREVTCRAQFCINSTFSSHPEWGPLLSACCHGPLPSSSFLLLHPLTIWTKPSLFTKNKTNLHRPRAKTRTKDTMKRREGPPSSSW